jgi:hypothetical protein
MLPEQMEAQLHEYGLTWAHKRHAVLDAGCVGQGIPGPKRMTQFRFKMPTYHLFECYVTVRKAPNVDMIQVSVLRNGGWAWETID